MKKRAGAKLASLPACRGYKGLLSVIHCRIHWRIKNNPPVNGGGL